MIYPLFSNVIPTTFINTKSVSFNSYGHFGLSELTFYHGRIINTKDVLGEKNNRLLSFDTSTA
jgi:hypothetical protein